MNKVGLEIFGRSDRGCVRDVNEDNLAIDEELGLIVVADGMGGHHAGEVASALAVSTVKDFARKMLGGDKIIIPEGGNQGLTPRGRQLECFVKAANQVIYQKGREVAKERGMGTTVVVLLADERSFTVAHVGDSRLYRYGKEGLMQLTDDHSLVGDQVKKGLLTADEASRSSLQNILTRALGTEEDVEVDIAEHPLFPGDVLLVASDGLTKEVTDQEIARVISADPAPQKVVDTLVEMARTAGGHDNITVAVARVPSGGWLQGLKNKMFGKGA